MRLMMKIGLRFLAMPLLAVVILLSGVNASAAADSPSPIPVRISNQSGFSRIVFEFPKLIAYHVKSMDGNVQIDFDTKASASLGRIKSPLIKTIRSVPNEEGLRVELTIASGATIKYYRLQRKIVLDVLSSEAKPKAPPAEKPKEEKPKVEQLAEKKLELSTEKPPTETLKVPKAAEPVKEPAKEVIAEKKEEPKKEAPPPAAAPAPVTATKDVTEDQLKEAITNPAALAALANKEAAKPQVSLVPDAAPEQLTAAPVAAVESSDEDQEDNPTKITLSSLTPMRLAVFERSNVLWIVTDSIAGTIQPGITGSMASFITPAKTLRFENATAYSYTLPKKFYPRIKKRSLSWDVVLLPAPYDPPASDETKISFDQISRKAKLIVQMKGAGDAISFEDPTVGDTLYVLPTNVPDQAVRNMRRLTDLEIVPAALGMVIRPLKDGVNASQTNELVFLTSADGLTLTPEGVGTSVLIGEADAVSDDDNARLYDFPNWQQGGIRRLQMNKQRIQEEIVAAKTPEERAGLLMQLAMLYFANRFGHEALGILDIVLSENAEMEKNPDFIAIRGAANAMAGHFKEALQDLSYPAIQQHPEVNLWIGFAAAATEQWRMADRSFPKSNRLLLQYPDNIAIPFTIYMAESALHLGHTDTAKKLLDTVNLTSEAMDPQYQAAINYLRGETFSQEGELKKAEEIWVPVVKGLDRLYHTKGTLSQTRILLKQKKITLKEAIERIDNLRFAWRGDGLEIEVLRTLGSLRVQNNQVLAGLEDMQQAAALSDSMLDDSEHIRNDMRQIFLDQFIGDQASKIPPLEAVSVYNEFNSLLPPGAEGQAATLDFVNYLINIDLLDKAAEIIEAQMKIGLPPEKAVSVGTKLAAVYLLNGKAQPALDALKKTEAPGMAAGAAEERSLLKARALSQLRQTDAAISTLSALSSKNAQRLRADVLWRAGEWNAAAPAIEALLSDASGASLSEEDAQLVVNAAVAWKLSGNADKLKEIREKYAAAIASTKQASTFGVVTRDGGVSALADRDSTLKIAGEVDMFKGFLDAYKAASGKGS